MATFIDWANQQRLKNVLKAGPYISNHFVSLIRVIEQYPWALMEGHTPLNNEIVENLCCSHNIAKWSAVFGLWGAELEVAAVESHIKQTLAGLGSLRIWDQKSLEKDINLSEKRKSDLLNLFRQMSGNITGVGLPRAYWRKKVPSKKNSHNTNLDQDKCGYLSINPCAPFIGDAMLTIAKLSSEIISKYGFEPNIAAYSTRPRILQFHITICFDFRISQSY